MSNQQKVLVSLTVLNSTCSQALAAVSAISITTAESNGPQLAVILKDYTSLLALVYSSATKIALALKPSAPTHSAAIVPIQEIAKQIASLSHCVGLIEITLHGATLRNEIILLTEDVINAIISLSETLLAIENSDSRTGTGLSGEEYMIRTGAVHDCIERAKQSSRDNCEAARKRMKLEEAPLNDALREVGEMIEDEESGDVRGDDDENGWDELGLGSSQKMSDIELQRTKKVHDLLKLTVLLHKRIRIDLIAGCSVALADKLVQASKSLSPATDDLSATLYTPQNIESMKAELSAMMQVLQNLDGLVTEALDMLDLNASMASTDVKDSSQAAVATKSTKKWTRAAFVTCFKQISSVASFFDTSPE